MISVILEKAQNDFPIVANDKRSSLYHGVERECRSVPHMEGLEWLA